MRSPPTFARLCTAIAGLVEMVIGGALTILEVPAPPFGVAGVMFVSTTVLFSIYHIAYRHQERAWRKQRPPHSG